MALYDMPIGESCEREIVMRAHQIAEGQREQHIARDQAAHPVERIGEDDKHQEGCRIQQPSRHRFSDYFEAFHRPVLFLSVVIAC